MTQLTPQQAFNLAMQNQQAGRLHDAALLYRKVLARHPDNIAALHNLGAISLALGQNEIAVDLIRRATTLRPDDANGLSNLANALKTAGKLDESISTFRRAIALQPNNPIAHNNFGSALKANGQLDEAIASFQTAIAQKPQYAEAILNLGRALTAKAQPDDAIAAFRQAIAINPKFAAAHYELGVGLKEKGLRTEAISSLRQAVALNPNLADARQSLGRVLIEIEQLDDAVTAFQQAIHLNPTMMTAYNGLAFALSGQARLDDAITQCETGIQIKPDDPAIYASYLFCLYHHPGYDSHQLLQAIRPWANRHNGRASTPLPPRDQNPERRLKIAYLSPFFFSFGESHFVAPLLENPDQTRFEIFAYSKSVRQDAITHRLRSHCNHWFDIQHLSNQAATELIRSHNIDILVYISRPADDCFELAANRLAPIQMTWLTYSSATTALDAMDYRISDPYLDPPGSDETCYSEQTLRLPETAWAYDPLVDPIPIGPLPAAANGFITFGSLNRISKINAPMITLWAQILNGVSNSRLHLLAAPGSHRQRLLTQFKTLDVDPQRIEFIAWHPRPDYLQQYNRQDISLDTLPFAGNTTSCDSLWMGVPLVTLTGRTIVGRNGASQLANLGLTDLIAQTPQQYAQIATQLAHDLPRLTDFRQTLRQRMQSSPLMDGPRFARNLEAAYRNLWTNWCKKNATT